MALGHKQLGLFIVVDAIIRGLTDNTAISTQSCASHCFSLLKRGVLVLNEALGCIRDYYGDVEPIQ